MCSEAIASGAFLLWRIPLSNTNAPNGFQFFRLQEGSAATQGKEPGLIKSDYTTAIGYGDLVIRHTDGYLRRKAAADAIAAFGVFVGCSYLLTATNQIIQSKSWPGSGNTGDVTAYVEANPSGLYVGQATLTAITLANIGENIDISVGTPDSEVAGGFSTSSLDASTLATTSTLPWQIYGLLSDYYGSAQNGTDNTASYNRVIVKPNNWAAKQLTGIA